MSSDVECPYCGKGQEICHDDGYGYEDGQTFEQECSDCDNTFAYTTATSFYYEANKCPCLNGEPHKMVKRERYDDCWPDWLVCEEEHCDHEDMGAFNHARY